MAIRTKKVTTLIEKAHRALEAAAKELNESGKLMTKEETAMLPQLHRMIRTLREMMIVHALSMGMTGAEVAAMYNLTPSRISQIKTTYLNRVKK